MYFIMSPSNYSLAKIKMKFFMEKHRRKGKRKRKRGRKKKKITQKSSILKGTLLKVVAILNLYFLVINIIYNS